MQLIISSFLFLLFLKWTKSQTSPLSIKIGMMFPANTSTLLSYDNTAGAATVALDRILAEKILPAGTNFTIIWRYEECVESTSTGYSLDLVKNEKVDVLFAPPCNEGALLAGHVGTYFNIPVMLWGRTFDSEFSSSEVYPTVMTAVSNYKDMAQVICRVMRFYKWNSYSLIYQSDEDGACFDFQQDMELVSQDKEDCTIAYKEPVDSWVEEDIQYTLNMIKATSRIVLMCFDDIIQQRKFTLKLSEAKLNTEEYVYLLPYLDMKLSLGASEDVFWVDTNPKKDGRDEEAKSIGIRSLVIGVDGSSELRKSFTNFSEEVMAHMSQWPFYCNECDRGQGASPYAAILYDAVYVYGLALSRVVNESGTSESVYRNGELISKNSDLQFEGMSGTVTIGADGVRDSSYFIYVFEQDGSLTEYLSLEVSDEGVNATPLYTDAASTIWASRGGFQPLAVPVCGFDGQSCPIDFFAMYFGYFIAAIIIGLAIIIGAIYGTYYIFSLRARDIERQNRLWQITTQALTPITGKNKLLESMRSLQSGPSTNSSKFTFDSVKSNKFYQVYVFRGERVVGIQHGATARLDSTEMAELRNMRNLDHENVNKFVGITIDGTEFISVWKYCSRGTLQDILGSKTFTLDGFFIYSLIRDLADGLAFIHSSFLECHGYLKSTNCLVDDRWQVKISDYGLKELRAIEKQQPTELLWTAPEILRSEIVSKNRAVDVYSFAVICSEVINMKPPWEPADYKGPEEIVYLVKKGGRQPARPPLEPVSSDMSPALLHLIKDCWSENPSERPKMETVKTLLKSMNTGKSANLMDHVFNMLETYAVSLEEEVEERTKELVEEKKKSDVLLYRMLPKQVAEKLKLGQSVEPESFECVTCFFSDVVSFTTLASRCTPLQVVNLLNDLYTVFDGIISEYDVYKVETIGDGYLCVSGLPHRNGNEHARHIANMSLAFMRSLDRFTIPHLPGERISLRIGIHTGGCVTGVVGLSMPRYCLFGDTINIASRMESNGKPNKIHMSAEANHFLTKMVGGYVTQSRGEVIIKGKGVMETFWLIGLENDIQAQREFYSREVVEQAKPKPNKDEDVESVDSIK